MRVLITGANGFLGSHLADVFLDRGFKVRCLVRRTADLKWLSGKLVEIQYCAGLDDTSALSESVAGAELVIHSAGAISCRTPQEYEEVNVEPVRFLLQTCKDSGTLQRFVLISSQGAAGPNVDPDRPVTEADRCHPVSAYGRSKLKAEDVTREYAGVIPFTILRPSAIYGPRDPNMLRLFENALRKGKLLYFGQPEKSMSLAWIHDIASGVYLAAVSSKTKNETYFLGSERFFSLDSISSALESAVGRNVQPTRVPEAIRRGMMLYGDFATRILGRKVLLDRDRLTTLSQPAWTCDVSKAKRDFGYEESISLPDGFRQTYLWYQQHKYI